MPKPPTRPALAQHIARQVQRRRRRRPRPLRGLGMFGAIGWAVALPTVFGGLLGRWLDGIIPGGRSWTLMFLLAGLALGCVLAWTWLGEQGRADEQQDDQDQQPPSGT